MAGISLREGARVIAGAAVPEDLLAEAVVVTVAGSEGSLPGTGGGSVKVTPLDRYPAKGRATGGVRSHRFLRGEDELVAAWVGVAPARALREGASRSCCRRPMSGATAPARRCRPPSSASAEQVAGGGGSYRGGTPRIPPVVRTDVPRVAHG